MAVEVGPKEPLVPELSLEEALENLVQVGKTARQNIAVYPVKAELTQALLAAELALVNHRAAEAKGANNA